MLFLRTFHYDHTLDYTTRFSLLPTTSIVVINTIEEDISQLIKYFSMKKSIPRKINSFYIDPFLVFLNFIYFLNRISFK